MTAALVALGLVGLHTLFLTVVAKPREAAAPHPSAPPVALPLPWPDIFQTGRTLGGATLTRHELGGLRLTSGRVVVTDPLVAPEREPLTRTVRPGTYRVALSVARLGNGDERVAAAMLQFSSEPVARWELAVMPGQDVRTLQSGEFFGYGVDAGLGCFLDAETAAHLVAHEQQLLRERGQRFYERLEPALVSRDSWSWALSTLPSSNGPTNLALFSSGWGDGHDASCWGLDSRGEPVALVTDFRLLR